MWSVLERLTKVGPSSLSFRYDDKRFSFTDAISFVVMERLGIPYAFSFDRDFAQYGLQLLTVDGPEL